MNPIKLVDPSGDILGAIIIPEEAERRLFINGELRFTAPTKIQYHYRPIPENITVVTDVLIKISHTRDDAVMIVMGTVYDFEKCPGCFFIPGYAFSQKGK